MALAGWLSQGVNVDYGKGVCDDVVLTICCYTMSLCHDHDPYLHDLPHILSSFPSPPHALNPFPVQSPFLMPWLLLTRSRGHTRSSAASGEADRQRS